MNDFVVFGNVVIRKDAIDVVKPEIVGKRIEVTVVTKGGMEYSSSHEIMSGAPRSLMDDVEYNRAKRQISEMLGEDLPWNESSGPSYRKAQPVRFIFLVLIWLLNSLASPITQLAFLFRKFT